MEHSKDGKITKLNVAYIKQRAMDIDDWRLTILGKIHAEHAENLTLETDELPIVSCHVSQKSWYVLTSRRVIGNYDAKKIEIQMPNEIEIDFGHFKGTDGNEVGVMKLQASSHPEYLLEFETGKASMAPIHYFRFWKLKYPILDILVG